MKTKTYKVQTWDEKGALKNHYTVEIASTAELAHLKKFLRKSSAHVVVAPVSHPGGVGDVRLPFHASRTPKK